MEDVISFTTIAPRLGFTLRLDESGRTIFKSTYGRFYGKLVTAFRRLVTRSKARRIPAEKVAASIERALVARRPRSRYLVGADARGQAIGLRLFGDRMLDFVVARVIRA